MTARFLLTTLASLLLANAGFAQAYEQRSGSNLDDCVEALNAQGGGWCEIRVSDKHPSISSVWPWDIGGRTKMNSGPKSVLTTWNSAAFDERNLLMYFMGGGHADYGGNEVYEFDLRAGKWTRLTDPSPLDHVYRYGKKLCWTTDARSVPPSVHTYDGLQFSKVSQTIFLIMVGPASGACFTPKEGEFEDDPRVLPRLGGIYEFNPSRTEERDGLAPLSWRFVKRETERLGYPRFLELPDGSLMVGSQSTMHRFDPTTGDIGKAFWQEGNKGDGLAEYHPLGLALSIHRNVLLIRDVKLGFGKKVPTPEAHGKSIAIDKDGIVFTWDGRNQIWTLDLTQPELRWVHHDWTKTGPKKGDKTRVYGKWQYITAHDVFVGLSRHDTGVWIYKHPADMPVR